MAPALRARARCATSASRTRPPRSSRSTPRSTSIRTSSGHARRAWHVSVHARHSPHGLPRQAVDDAPVRRLRQRGRHERALQVPARPWPDGTVDGIRLPDAHGLRLGSSAIVGRSRQDRRRHLEPRRHGGAVRRHPARQGVDVDDDQRPGDHSLGVLRRGGGEAGRVVGTSCAARFRTTF